jgi:uncharacterized secreted protein with C-terminal beta-propeller domain
MRIRRASLFVIVTGAVATLAGGGCPPEIAPPTVDAQIGLRRFNSQQELLDFFKSQAVQRSNTGGLFRNSFAFLFGAPMAAADAQAGAAEDTGASAAADADAYSTTNIQEAGIDESDVFKSDGTYFYVARDTSVRVVDAARLVEVGRVDVGVHVDSMYLSDSRLIVLGFDDTYRLLDGAEIMIWPPYYPRATLTVLTVDVSHPTAPAISGQVELDGALVSSRMIEQRLILVLTIAPDLPEQPTVFNIADMQLDDILPTLRVGGSEQTMVPWTGFYRPGSPDGYLTTAVITLDTTDIERVIDSVAVMADAGTIYVSQNALYLTDSDYDASDNYREMTVIHKLAFGEDGRTEVAGSARVPGRLLNQFSLGEYEGFLRVATHVTDWGFFGGGWVDDVAVAVAEAPAGSAGQAVPAQQRQASGPYNAVYVLGDGGEGGLELIGSIEDIAPGEDIRSARFLGDTGYVVTFRQIDPLFVLDLSDPAAPELVGELKIPGYSDYLHPFGELLIGVGRSATSGGQPYGMQLSLFDVSDKTDPKLIQQVELGGYGSQSDVTQTHKAFTFMPAEGLLAIPGYLMPEQYMFERDSWGPTFVGVLYYRVTAQGFTELGRVQAVTGDASGWWYDYGEWRRGAIANGTAFALSNYGIRSAPLEDFASTMRMEFSE